MPTWEANTSRTDRPGLRSFDKPFVYQLATLAVLGSLWEIQASRTNSLMIPTFLETVAAAGRLLRDAAFWSALAISNEALIYGLIAAILLGVPLGVAMGRFRRLEQLTDVYVSILIVTPMAALIPLILMSIGIGIASRVLIVFVFAIVMIIVQSRAGVRQVDLALLEMSRSYGATERQMWTDILLPSAVPAIMTGIRLGLGRAITGMVIGELLLVSVGIGSLILRYRGFFMAPELYATIILVILEALVLVELARRIEKRMRYS